jgi:DNA-binding LacI/PurR family transcriptional regulator
MAKIHDVAERAGVSPATVSRYLSGRTVRSADAIAEAVRALEYSPSAIARSLKSGVTRNIGVVVPDIANPFFASAVKGIEKASRNEAYNIFLANSDESAERQDEILQTLVGMVDALIVTPAIEYAEVPAGLARHEVPVVLLDREWREDHGFDSVVVDNFGGARQAVRHLAQLGHTRIATIAGPLESTPGRLRYEGFIEAVRAAGLEEGPELVHRGDFRETSGYLGLKALLGLSPPPTAVFAANNLMAVGALRACKEAGLRLPHDLSFVSFDDLELGELLTPAITSISRPTTEQGELAMSLLSERLNGNALSPARRCVLETRLSVRDSTGPRGRTHTQPRPKEHRERQEDPDRRRDLDQQQG